MSSTFYEVLGVSKSATDADIKKAFKELAKKYHPDKHPGQTFYEEHFKKINTAYQTLSDPQARKVYDLRLFYAHTSTKQQQPPPHQNRSNPNQQKTYANTHGPRPNTASQSQAKRAATSQSRPRSASDQKKLNKYYLFIAIGVIVLTVFSYWFYHFMNDYTSNIYYVEGLKEELEHNDRSAMNNYMVAVEYNKNNAAATEKTADMYVKLLADYDEAYKLYTHAYTNFEQSRDQRRVAFKLVRTLVQLSNYNGALMELQQMEVLPDEEKDDSILYYRGDIFFTKELYKDSRAYFTEFFDKHPKSVESKIKMALCHFNEGNEDYAMVDLNDAIYAFPKRGEAYYYKGRIRIVEKDTAAACKLFKKADSLNYRQGNEALYIYCH